MYVLFISLFEMKVVVVFTAAAVIAACVANPVIPKDNSHYVEGESRYIWMTDDEDAPRLVDLQKPIDDVAVATATGANNQYWLFTRNNPTNRQIITHNSAASIWISNYVASRPLKVIVHGWTNNGNHYLNIMTTAAFLAVQDANVIVLDWSSAAALDYISAVSRVPDVGQHLGAFLTWLINTTGGNWNDVHLVGFSLGAHVVGNAGRSAAGNPSRVTGLDPAGPLWHTNAFSLSVSDGQYVEAIHTDGLIQGIYRPIGHADFYPNGGVGPMPGCSGSPCSHARAYEYFAASIRYNHLVGRSCQDLNQATANQCTGSSFNMGNGILTKRGSGLFGLTTGASWPY